MTGTFRVQSSPVFVPSAASVYESQFLGPVLQAESDSSVIATEGWRKLPAR